MPGRRVDVAGARQRALLAVLLLQAGEVVFGGPAHRRGLGRRSAGGRRHRAPRPDLSAPPLARTAGELLVTRAPGYVVRLEAAEQLDLRRFERLVDDGGDALARNDARGAAESLRQALALWRGPPLGDVGGAPFAPIAVARLEELRIVALELRVEAELRLGRARPPRRRAARARRGAPAARAAVGPADDRALSRRPPGRRARGLSRGARPARRRDRARAGPGSAGARAAHPGAGPGAAPRCRRQAPPRSILVLPRRRYRPRASPGAGGAARRRPRPGSAHRRARRRRPAARRGRRKAERRARGRSPARGAGPRRGLHIVQTTRPTRCDWQRTRTSR